MEEILKGAIGTKWQVRKRYVDGVELFEILHPKIKIHVYISNEDKTGMPSENIVNWNEKAFQILMWKITSRIVNCNDNTSIVIMSNDVNEENIRMAELDYDKLMIKF